MRVALVIGHTLSSGGAKSSTGVSEFEYNEELVGMIANNLSDLSDVDTLIFYRDSYAELPEQINLNDPDLIISFHCNAFNTKATGTETLYYHSSIPGQQVADRLQGAMHSCLGLVNRGIKPKHSEDRGGYLLAETNAPCVIIEPFFIDNPLDFEVGKDLKYELSIAIAEVIEELS